MKLSKEKIMSALGEVLDPELNISIVDLGLVYNVKIEKAIPSRHPQGGRTDSL
ncbi:MAG: hypothetical protein UU94_C0018G0001, partial [Candidatus Collierbacteria bacterium GW2011_GWB2_42_12]